MIVRFFTLLILICWGGITLFVHVIFPNMILHESSFLGNTVAHAKAMVGYEEDLVRVTEYRENERKEKVRKARERAEEAACIKAENIDLEIADLNDTLKEWNNELTIRTIHFRLDVLKMIKKDRNLSENDAEEAVRVDWRKEGKL